jgi:AraC-like DNA-binding protein
LITHNAKKDPLSVLHCHDVIEIGICLKGSGVFIIDNRLFNYQKGDLVFISPDIYHRARSSNHKDDLWHFLYFNLNDRSLPGSLLKLPSLIPQSEAPELYQLIMIICKEMISQHKGYQGIVNNLVQALIDMLARVCRSEYTAREQEFPLRAKVTDLRIIRAMDLIISSGTVQHSIDELAEECNLSVSHFRFLFKEHLGIGPKQFQTKVKLRKAMNLLKERKFRIVDISFECGFQSLSSFNRHFKKETGISPVQWRNEFSAK